MPPGMTRPLLARVFFLVAAFVVLAILFASRARPAGLSECGLASVYGTVRDGHAGSRTASGERLDGVRLTAAHRTLPFGSYVAVRSMRHLGTRQAAASVTVRINDRGPFVHGRVIDLSTAAALALGMGDGLWPVCLDVVVSSARN